MRVVLVGATVAASAVILSPTSAFAAAEGPVTLSVASGTAATNFNMTLPSGAACSGGGAANYRWESFIASASIDVSTLIFTDGPNQPAGTFTSTLTSAAGDLIKQMFPAATPTGLISGIPQFNFSSLVGSGITAGAYKVGIFCANLNTPGTVGRLDTVSLASGHYWEKLITVTNATTMAWSTGATPPALTLNAVTPGDGTCAFSTGFTTTPADPAATYAAATVPATVSTPVTPGTPFTLSSLLNGTAYSVTVTATNTVGSTVSNAVSCTPNPGLIAAPVLTATSAVGQVSLSWTTPAAPPAATLLNYIVTATVGTVTGSPFTVAAGTNTLVVTGLASGSYAFTVQAIYAAPYVGAVSAPASASSNNAQTLIQDVTVVRPVGALVLTQRCGVYGSAPAYSDNVFGTLTALAATPLSADPVGGYGGEFPYGTLPVGTPFNGQPSLDAAGTTGDPLYPQYPYPVDSNGDAIANYPTHCGINLGAGKLITSGPRAGQYFTATGRIAQITVVNTQDVDSSWTLNGQMSDFLRTGGGDSFSGNLLGWNPEVTWDSNPNLDLYDMQVLAGDERQPVATLATSGLGTSSVVNNAAQGTLPQTFGARAASLAKSTFGRSLGMAVIDARLRLLIPVAANAGTYTGTLTFTTV